MDDTLEIPVIYKGQELSFPARFLLTGYTHKFQVEVDGQFIMFEPDEEINYRVVLDSTQLENGSKLDIPLLQSIAAVLNAVLK